MQPGYGDRAIWHLDLVFHTTIELHRFLASLHARSTPGQPRRPFSRLRSGHSSGSRFLSRHMRVLLEEIVNTGLLRHFI
jgi:hypothetical protein